MNPLREDPHRAVILGGGCGGSAILEMLLDEKLVQVVGIVDTDPDALGLALAKEHDIPTYNSVEQALHDCAPCVAFNMTGNEMIEEVAASILGAGGVIGGMEARLMHNMISNLKDAKDKLHYEASHDPLTSLYNRRHLLQQMQQGISQALRYQYPYTIAMFDLDHFKQVNDVHGHNIGDRVLVHLSDLLKKNMRESDISGRWGGEEFVVLLPHTNLEGAVLATEQWLEQLHASPILLDDGQALQITFSAGLATLNLDAQSNDIQQVMEQLLHVADERMYAAKAQGRNRVCATSKPETTSADHSD